MNVWTFLIATEFSVITVWLASDSLIALNCGLFKHSQLTCNTREEPTQLRMKYLSNNQASLFFTTTCQQETGNQMYTRTWTTGKVPTRNWTPSMLQCSFFAVSTACVSSPRDWATSIGSHMKHTPAPFFTSSNKSLLTPGSQKRP